MASFFLALAIAIYWSWMWRHTNVAPLVSFSLAGQVFVMSRAWDSFLGLFGFVFVYLIAVDRSDEPGGIVGDIVTLMVGAVSGYFLACFILNDGFGLAIWQTMQIVAVIAAAMAFVMMLANHFRSGLVMFAGIAFGMAAYSGVVLGAITFVVLFWIYSVVAVLYIAWTTSTRKAT